MKHAFLLLAAFALAASAHASYGQMRLDGIALLLVFMLTVPYVMFVNLALVARFFRYGIAAVLGSSVALLLALALLGLAASSGERAGFFKLFSGGSGPLVLLVTGVLFLPFSVIAPLAQYLSMREGRRWPGWVTAWMCLQLAVVPGFIVLGVTEPHYWERERADALALGNQVKAGELGALLARAEQRKERIWGTGWTYPWPHDATTSSSAWPLGLSLGLEASAPIAANEPLSEPDRTALQALMERHFRHFASAQIQAKLIWDELEPGDFSRQLAPAGLNEAGVVSEDVIPPLLDRLEKYGELRLCPGGRMMEADRALLTALVLEKVQLYEGARQRELAAELEVKQVEAEMSQASGLEAFIWKAERALGSAYGNSVPPDWEGHLRRVERLCPGPG